MQFKEKKSIFSQIADQICENIILGIWEEESRIPSVREFSVDVQVNPNTVMRSYNSLQDKGIIYNKRGIGYFVSKNSKKIVRNMKKEKFIKTELPEIFKTIQLLDISITEISTMYNNYIEGEQNENK